MGEVLKFEPPEKEEPHLSGRAVCLACRHEWVAVAPVGVWKLECPDCRCPKGIFQEPVGADEGDLCFFCSACGCEALTAIWRKGHFYLLCMSCGVNHTESIFG